MCNMACRPMLEPVRDCLLNNFVLVIWMMIIVIVRMNECSLNFWQGFDIRLKSFTDVMRFTKDHVLVKHNVNL
ncbi:hypothetical protein GCK72_019325 [Caenorhabditis remanei]|uniref:Uncharacterized protein n=1 Tax=Caenorhabditis remanei TaxID=31234 RepID=A0A6A5GCE6_CAERE|nr:hypothetical protein GCK72_019325 [Caenorhabditis remanei]KAF1752770.1 hypothetical protein GCK72_019325 [Caenorhabditis remanei]